MHSRAAVPEAAGESPARAPSESERPGSTWRRRLAWAGLLKRVFAIDVLECPCCSGPMRILATIHPPDATRAILECLGLPVRAPPIAPARNYAEPCSEWPNAAPDEFES